MLEVFCCPCLWIPAMRRAREEEDPASSASTRNAIQRQGGLDNPFFTSNQGGQQITIAALDETRHGHQRRSRSQTRGKQFHLGALIELACQADRKTTQRHVDGLSVESQGAEVHNLYHLYAILSLAHQADNARASQHYKEWSRLVSSEASTSRGRSDFYGLPTYEQAVALSHEADNIVDVNVLTDNTTGPYTGQVNASFPVNITIPTYEELMGSNSNANRLSETVPETRVNISEENENMPVAQEQEQSRAHMDDNEPLPAYNEICNGTDENSAQ